MKTNVLNTNLSVVVSFHPVHKDITLLAAKGFIDTTTAPEFDKAFQKALAEKRFNLIVDLREVTYVSSAGWGLFVGEIKRIRGQKGNLFLASMSPEVEEAYELLQFGTIIKSFPNVDEAAQKGFGKPKTAQAGSAAGKGTKGKSSAPAVSAAQAPGAHVPSATQGTVAPKKEGWLGRLFKPWKWF